MEENKLEKYYYSIGEVAKMFGVNTSMIAATPKKQERQPIVHPT